LIGHTNEKAKRFVSIEPPNLVTHPQIALQEVLTSASHDTLAGHHCQMPRLMMRVNAAGMQPVRLISTWRLINLPGSPHRFRIVVGFDVVQIPVGHEEGDHGNGQNRERGIVHALGARTMGPGLRIFDVIMDQGFGASAQNQQRREEHTHRSSSMAWLAHTPSPLVDLAKWTQSM
jgi:hypothetical protein